MLLAQICANDIRKELKWPMIGMLVGALGYLINSTPLAASQGIFDPWVDLVSITTTGFIWLFARNLFEQEPPRSWMLGVAVIFLLGWFSSNFVEPYLMPGFYVGFFILHIASLVLIGDLIRVGVFGRNDDLLEDRRTIRLWLPLLLAAQAAGILIFEIAEVVSSLDGRSPIAQLINSLLIFVLILFSGIAFLRSDVELLVQTSSDTTDDDDTAPLNLSPSETVLHEKLTAAIKDGAYRTPGLSIAGLANQLDTPEHRLRALINQRMGYRNFSAFLNRHRIAEAREKLTDKDHVDLPVLTIAMDLGYNSLATFNRAFRSETGTTPSDYRRLNLAEHTVQN